jgi:hypothetical protein
VRKELQLCSSRSLEVVKTNANTHSKSAYLQIEYLVASLSSSFIGLLGQEAVNGKQK